MSSLNKVLLIGRLGKDPELRTLENGGKVCTFSLATSEKYKDRDGNKKENTEWHNIVLWNQRAEIAYKYLSKGSQVHIEGKLTTRSWKTDSGEAKYITEIIGSNIIMLSKALEKTEVQPTSSTIEEDDDLPY